MEVINPMNNQLRPFSGRPTTGRPTTSKPNVEIEIESNSNSLKNITESEDIESSNSVSSKEKFEFLDSVVGGKQKEMITFRLPESDIDRSFVVIEKIKKTPKQYPRKAGIPSKEPLC